MTDSTETAGTYALDSPLAFSVATIAGTVTDADDLPVEGAWVLAMDASNMMGGGGGGGGGSEGGGEPSEEEIPEGCDPNTGEGCEEFMSAEGAKGDDGSVSTSGEKEDGPEYFAISDANGAYKLGTPTGVWAVMS
ncbi:MAG: hypothetical protein QF805_32090, partial [Pirellulaceae bacterium]|nr:hypothetical protein [Pirellulaceae bacterium]